MFDITITGKHEGNIGFNNNISIQEFDPIDEAHFLFTALFTNLHPETFDRLVFMVGEYETNKQVKRITLEMLSKGLTPLISKNPGTNKTEITTLEGLKESFKETELDMDIMDEFTDLEDDDE